MDTARRSRLDRYKQLRIKKRYFEAEREKASKEQDMTKYADMCRSIRRVHEEIQEVLQAL